MNKRRNTLAFVTALAIGLSALGISAVSAQGPGGQGGPGGSGGPGDQGGRMVGFGGAVCSTTNYTDVAAKALGIDSPTLRKALVSGKSLEEIASGKSVSIDTVDAALVAAHEADLKQALTDGLITQQEYDATKSLLDRAQN